MTEIECEPPAKKCCLENNSVSEAERYTDVGIEEFLNKEGIGFSGKVKERWEDFVVNEVDLNKKTIYLTSLDLPESINKIINIENKHIDENIIKNLDDLYTNPRKNEVQFDASDDKLIRTDVYNFIKLKYPTLYGNTEMRDGKRVFVITNYADDRSQVAKKIAKISGDDDYCQFVLYKEGKDTIAAINMISTFLRMKPGNFTYAGTKDRRGITTQLITVRSCAANRLKGLNKCLRGITLGNFSYVHTPLKLGDLFGNRFRLIIREVDGSDQVIHNAVNRFKNGFINYFGLQRFGSTDIRSHEIGKLAIGSKWEEMIKLILQPTLQDLPYMRDCKTKFKESLDCDEFLRSCNHGIEHSIISGVSKHGFTLNAIDNLPRNLRQLYVHSYQSYIWNKMVSKRIREIGNETVLAGDLVEIGDEVKALSESEVDQYNIQDIIMPLPGYDVKLPENQMAEWYRDILARDGLSLEKLRHRVKEFSLPGSYRKLVTVPLDLKYSTHNYKDSSVPLIETDSQKLRNDFILPQSEGPLKAIIIEFTLPKSGYATIAIRELMKTVKVIQ